MKRAKIKMVAAPNGAEKLDQSHTAENAKNGTTITESSSAVFKK